MTTEQAKEQARDLGQRMYECPDAREFCERSFSSIMAETLVLVTAMGDAEIFGVVSRPVDGREKHEAAGFVFFTSVGVWTIALAQNGQRDEAMKPALERVEELRLVPSSKITSVTVGRFDARGLLREDINPAFAVDIEGVGDVVVNERTSRDGFIEGAMRGPLFAHVRDLLAARQ